LQSSRWLAELPGSRQGVPGRNRPREQHLNLLFRRRRDTT
jgi:hypothetical protein